MLILAEEASVEPRPLAEDGMLDGAHSVRLAGFGNTDVFSTGGYGIRRMVDVPLASNDPQFGADAATEFVAGAPFLDRDSCNGDSGGPAYVQADGEWFLVGATSRATASTVRPCGDGGIYVRCRSSRTGSAPSRAPDHGRRSEPATRRRLAARVVRPHRGPNRARGDLDRRPRTAALVLRALPGRPGRAAVREAAHGFRSYFLDLGAVRLELMQMASVAARPLGNEQRLGLAHLPRSAPRRRSTR